ncbi:MAG: glutathione S-transferase family protein [Immundisolibacteraceae bacterium]|nr:glutathione S-transferase family protein [Immundisolibacteraceae bacterium]
MLELYAFPFSGNSRKATIVLEEVGAEYQYNQIDLMQGEQKQPSYLEINPNGKVPVLGDGDLLLWESSAILIYIAEKFPAAELIPTDPILRAEMHQWLVWQPGTYNPPVSALNGQLMFTPTEQQDPEQIATLRQTVAANTEIVATRLADQPYLLGAFSLADIVMLPHLSAAAERGVELSAKITNYLARLQTRPSWQKVSSMTP